MISVILPTYNERENIERLINSIYHNLEGIPKEIIVVDDDSPDKTWEIVEGMSKVNDNIKVRRRIKQKGLVDAIKEGINLARGNIVILMDADFSMPPDILMRMINYLDNFDMVVGSRYVKDAKDLRDSRLRVYGSRLFNLLARWILSSKVRDLTSGFLVFKKTAIDLSDMRGHYGEYCIGLLYKAQKDGVRITEFPYNFVSREGGETKTDPNIFRFIQLGIIYILFVLKLKFNNIK